MVQIIVMMTIKYCKVNSLVNVIRGKVICTLNNCVVADMPVDIDI